MVCDELLGGEETCMCVCVCTAGGCEGWGVVGHHIPTHSSRASPPAIIILLFISVLTVPKISY